jgi:hypothetical protein
MSESGRTAITIYAVMARDPIDALDMINECVDLAAIRLLNEMVNNERPGTDNDLNRWFRSPVKNRLNELEAP